MGGRHRGSVFYKKTHNSFDGLRQENVIDQNIKVINEFIKKNHYFEIIFGVNHIHFVNRYM